MRWFSFIIIVFAATLLEASSLLKLFAIGGLSIRPSLLIILLVYYAMVFRSDEAVICSFMIGFAMDLASGVMGPHTVCYGIIGTLLNQMGQSMVLKRALYKSVVILLVYILAAVLANWLSLIKPGGMYHIPFSVILMTGFVSGLIGPLVWSILAMMTGWAHIKKERSEWFYR